MGKYLDLLRPIPLTAERSDLNPPRLTEAAGPYPDELRRSVHTLGDDGARAGDTTETTKTTKAPPAESGVLDMPLSRFEWEGCPLEIQVPGLAETLWFVPGT